MSHLREVVPTKNLSTCLVNQNCTLYNAYDKGWRSEPHVGYGPQKTPSYNSTLYTRDCDHETDGPYSISYSCYDGHKQEWGKQTHSDWEPQEPRSYSPCLEPQPSYLIQQFEYHSLFKFQENEARDQEMQMTFNSLENNLTFILKILSKETQSSSQAFQTLLLKSIYNLRSSKESLRLLNMQLRS